MVGDQESRGRSLQHGDRQPQLVLVIGSGGNDFDQAAAVLIDPAAGVRRHFKRRWHIQQMPDAVDFDKDPLSMAAEEPEVGVAGRKEAIDAHMPLRDHRMKHAVHPCG